MKLIILAIFIACSSAAKLNRAYLPPNYAQTSGGSGDFLQTPLTSSPSSFNGLTGQGFNNKDTIAQIGNDYAHEGNGIGVDGRQNGINAFDNYNSRAERPRAALERNAATLRQVNENNGDAYSYAFETENGIIAEENGVATNGVEAQGGYSYTGDDGQVYSIRYTAGQNGFVPEGDHLPTPPAIPEEILMALEQNARDEAAGIYDDGSYNENKYNGEYAYGTPNYSNSNVNRNNINNLNNDDSVVVNSAINREGLNQPGSITRNTILTNQQSNDRVDNVYLPPISDQRSSVNQIGGSRFGARNRQPSFNPRNGYHY